MVAPELRSFADLARHRWDCLGRGRHGYSVAMLYTILIILAIVALVIFILGRR